MTVDDLKQVVHDRVLLVKELSEQYDHAFDGLRFLIENLIREGDKDSQEFQELINFAYWETPITTKQLCAAIGCTTGTLLRTSKTHHKTVFIQARPVNLTCRLCKGTFTKLANSKSRAKELSTDRFAQCDSCLEEQKNAQLEWRLRDAEHRVRTAELQRQRPAELEQLAYNEYLQTPEWKARREYMLRRAKYRCLICNGSLRLEVHHRFYPPRGTETEEHLAVLCHECHGLFSANGKLKRN